MHIRRALTADLEQITSLFYETITRVNTNDYTPRQIEVWAANASNTEGWLKRIAEQYFYVADNAFGITGFASLSTTGYLDLLFVHHAYQGQGIATTLLSRLEADAKELQLGLITTDASITARPFFEAHGYTVEEAQEKMIKGVSLQNFKMQKTLARET